MCTRLPDVAARFAAAFASELANHLADDRQCAVLPELGCERGDAEAQAWLIRFASLGEKLKVRFQVTTPAGVA